MTLDHAARDALTEEVLADAIERGRHVSFAGGYAALCDRKEEQQEWQAVEDDASEILDNSDDVV